MKRLACAALAGGLIVATAWAQNPRVWSNPIPPATEVLDRLNLRLGWRTGVPVEGYRDGIATVQNLGDLIVVQRYRGPIEAIDPVTGAVRWRTTVGEPYPVIYRLGYSDAIILVANGTRIFGLDRPTGKQLWAVDLSGTPSSPPAANGDAFYVCLSNGRLSAYAFPVEASPPPETAATTAGAAKTAVPPGTPRTPPVPARAASTAMASRSVDPSKALAGGGGRTVTVSGGIDSRSATTALQVTGGRTAVGAADITRAGRGAAVVGGPRLLWDYQTNLRVSERPALGEKHLLVIGTGRDALFIDKTGAKPQTFTADASFTAPLGQYGDTVYAACGNGTLYAFDLPTRTTLWQVTATGAITERPVTTDDDLFVVAEGSGLARRVRFTGELVWKNPAAVGFVAVNPKFVYARDGLGRLLILDRARGTTSTTLDIRDFTVSLPNNYTDRLVLGANDGTLVSLYDRAYPQPLRLRNPPAAVIPVTPPPANPDDAKEAKPEPPPEPKPMTPKAPTAPPKANPPGSPPPTTPPPAKPPTTPPATPPPATPPVTPPPANPPPD